MNVISISNQRGGVSKSTTSHALATGLSFKGYKTLIIDLDGQGNTSYTAKADNKTSIYDVMTNRVTADEAIQRLNYIDIIPSSKYLTSLNLELVSVGKEYKLKKVLEEIKSKYDFVIIDTPPTLDIRTINALTASNYVIIPAQAEIYSVHGIVQLYETIQAVKEYTNKDLQIKGILLTRYNPRSILGRDMRANITDIAKSINTFVYSTTIRECVKLKEAQAIQQNIFDYAGLSNAAKDYTNFINEFLERTKLNGRKEKL